MVKQPTNQPINEADKLRRERLLKFATNASVLVATLLVIIKSIAWFQTGSVAMMGSLLDSILDAAAAIINLIFIRSALRPADTEHRFGHGKAEPIGGMFQAMIIGGSAVFLIAESVRRIIEPEMPTNSSLGISIMLISSVLVATLVFFQRYVVKQTGSMIVSADALHGFGDILINLGVIVALFISTQFDAPLADPVIGILLAGILLKGSWNIGNSAMQQLMDTEFSQQEREHIRTIARQHSRVRDIHDLRTRHAGFSSFIQLHLEMDGNMNLTTAHQIADEVEQSIKNEFTNAEVLIHQDPQGTEDIDSFLRS
ncbi:MAG: cation diffusion facilitator family transporter [Pseudomonadales bacterium]